MQWRTSSKYAVWRRLCLADSKIFTSRNKGSQKKMRSWESCFTGESSSSLFTILVFFRWRKRDKQNWLWSDFRLCIFKIRLQRARCIKAETYTSTSIEYLRSKYLVRVLWKMIRVCAKCNGYKRRLFRFIFRCWMQIKLHQRSCFWLYVCRWSGQTNSC